uniref:Serine/threonine-protein kinase n=1 Tax=Seriola dumerili TaxID=41447 RepID=A0A3B4UHR9_SERDU
MERESERKIKTQGCPALGRDRARSSSSTTKQSASPAEDSKNKRKASPDNKTQRKKRRTSEVTEPCHSCKEDGRVRGEKRKVGGDGEGPSEERKKRKTSKCAKKPSVDVARARFKARYEEQNQLGEGGCGSVFAGYRKSDKLPVAIKHIPMDKVFCKHVARNGKELSVEVAVMLKLAKSRKKGEVGTSAPVALLDWYDLGQELILVLERPVPAEDLLKYTEQKGGCLQEEEGRIILKQLVNAALELQEKRIFHRDIKIENILIETGSNTPRVRIIDFGLSCFTKKTSSYTVFYGTSTHAPPEWYSCCHYRPGPSTVWQLGVVLYEILHKDSVFETIDFLTNRLQISNELSNSCRDFLNKCLTRIPYQRPTLQELKRHHWLA